MGSRRRQRVRSTAFLALVLGAIALGGLYVLGRAEGLPSLAEGRIPVIAHDAYLAASAAAPTVAAECAVHWTVLAGIAQVESRHGILEPEHRLTDNGDVLPEIRGRALDGTGGTAALPDTDGGELDGDATWDRALGPLQFTPSTWRELGRDGNGDGVADPDNLYDAALTAAAHLCLRAPGNYEEREDLRAALVAYNPSGRYAEEVLGWIQRYRTEPLAEVIEELEPDSG